jgi:hypothetical protein
VDIRYARVDGGTEDRKTGRQEDRKTGREMYLRCGVQELSGF